MQPIESSNTPVGARRLVGVVAAAAATLTSLFTAQDLMRRGFAAGGSEIAHALSTDALDWFSWGALAIFIYSVGRTHRLDDPRRRRANIAIWIGLAIVCCATHAAVTGALMRTWGLLPGNGPLAQVPMTRFLVLWVVSTAGFNFIIFVMVAGVFHATMYYRDLRARAEREAALEGRLARAELNVLRMQLQPHFLFNALHTISSLVVTDPETAQRVVTALGDLLRSSLDHTARQEVPLRDELEFVERYVAIQRARFRQRLIVDVDVDGALLDAAVPSLVLQPLVENAIRHGIEPFAAGGRVSIAATRDGPRLSLCVRDESLDRTPRPRSANGAAPGIGLANIEARLAQLYGPNHELRAAPDSDGSFTVTMSLPFHIDPVDAARGERAAPAQ